MSTPAGDGEDPGAGTLEAAAPFSADWKERILVPVVAAGVAGAGFGLLSRHRARLGPIRAAATYAANLSIVAGCYGDGIMMRRWNAFPVSSAPFEILEMHPFTIELRGLWF
ncbi:unnamed protein product [Triticum turgidum subsp. durum]|uniref:Uncharacterized protein n=1 Tax=Triticum turgidum subsp. durum TaxID=4567 RepID=A0A9R1RMR0_TRITD|nr:unnamed protein product [Triticum turgidum subsp. durum]